MNPEQWKRVKEIYQSAIELEPGRREAHLKEICAGDESLLAEVTSLFEQGSEEGALFEAPAIEVAAKALVQQGTCRPAASLAGQTLLHYRVEKTIGEGGMGVVYRAEDTILRRNVAVKVLPDEFTDDEERMARFEREARLLASLSHPNIATLHGLEACDGRRFIVMELIDGQTLSDRLRRGSLPLEEALGISRQIADGLEAAHTKGVIHRDLKPGNVMITSGGAVKILDFGLARVLRDPGLEPEPTISEEITGSLTDPNVVLGTAAYMSPEQAKGQPVDKRADIWAFGCILYECLTGKRPFAGETASETVAAILKSEPEWTALPAETPFSIRMALRHCLQKDPRSRLHDIADARVEMEERIAEPPAMTPVVRRLPLGWILVVGAATLGVGFLAGLLLESKLVPPSPAPVVAYDIHLPPGQSFPLPARTAVALSHDGRFVVYPAVTERGSPSARRQLYVRWMERAEAKAIAGTEGGCCPFLSPDDRWVGFWEGGKLRKVPVGGGMVTTLCDARMPFGFDWGTDNTIVFAGEERSGLSRVSGNGGQPEMLTLPRKDRDEYGHCLPRYLPGGTEVLFTIMGNGWDLRPRLALLDMATRKWRVLVEDAADGRYLPTGHLVFLRRGTLHAAALDLRRLEMRQEPAPVVSNVMQALNSGLSNDNTGAGQYTLSGSGWLAYLKGGIAPDFTHTLTRVDRKGNSEAVTDFREAFLGPRLSPDGRHIAYFTTGSRTQVSIYGLDRGIVTRLTTDGIANFPVWTPDGKNVVFGWSKSQQTNLYLQAADGSTPMQRLTISDRQQNCGSFTPDGSTLAFAELNDETNWDVLLLDMRSRKVRPFVNSNASEMWPEFSPDGRWIAYASKESGTREVWVRPFPGPGGRWQISRDQGISPVWSRDGKQLFYRQGAKVWVVDVRADRDFEAGRPRLLFENEEFQWAGPIRGWDVWPDGKDFLFVKDESVPPPPVTQMTIVQNWLEELKRLVPARGN